MIQQTIFPFKIETTKERLTAHGGLALMGEFNHGIGLRELTDRYLPSPGSNRGFDAFGNGGQFGVNVTGGREEVGRSAGIKTGAGVNEINWAG